MIPIPIQGQAQRLIKKGAHIRALLLLCFVFYALLGFLSFFLGENDRRGTACYDYSSRDDADYQTEAEGGNRLGVAVHVFDVISSLVGVFVILILIAMLLTLVDWLRTDLLHSFVLLQSGIS